MKLFYWLDHLPRDFKRPADTRHRVQVPCWVALPTQAGFLRLIDEKRSFLPYVSVMPKPGGSTGAQLAWDDPGVVYMHDEFNFKPGENVWIKHPAYVGRTP